MAANARDPTVLPLNQGPPGVHDVVAWDRRQEELELTELAISYQTRRALAGHLYEQAHEPIPAPPLRAIAPAPQGVGRVRRGPVRSGAVDRGGGAVQVVRAAARRER